MCQNKISFFSVSHVAVPCYYFHVAKVSTQGDAQRFAAKRSGGFGKLNCLYPQMFISGTTAYIRTSTPFFLGAVCAQYGHLIVSKDTKYSRRLKSFIGKLLEYIEPISTRQAGLL